MAENDEIIRTLNDATAFPLWFENVGKGGDITTVGGAAGSGSLGRLVSKTIGDTLGWRVRANDPKGFLAALTNSFQLEEKQGVVLSKWTPHNLSIQADLGQLSGAQASLAARSKVITDIVRPMLEGLQPLQPDADAEDCAALTALISSNVQKINDEMWKIGGPVVQYIDQLFTILFGDGEVKKQKLKEPQHVEGQLGDLRDLFGYGYDAGYVNTVDDETHLTNFMIVINYIDMLRVIWRNQRHIFTGKQGFLGTQLILLARDLDMVAEGVDEVNFAMDSVLLGAGERQTLRLNLPGEAPLTFANLLDEGIGQWALTDGKYILQYGGKDGVKSTFIPVLQNLLSILTKLITTPPKLPKGFGTPRVQITLQNLQNYLQQTLKDADNIKRDRVKFVDERELKNTISSLGIPILGEVKAGESKTLFFSIPDAKEIVAVTLAPTNEAVTIQNADKLLHQDGQKIKLEIVTTGTAQLGHYTVNVVYKDLNGASFLKSVLFTVV